MASNKVKENLTDWVITGWVKKIKMIDCLALMPINPPPPPFNIAKWSPRHVGDLSKL